MLLADVDLSTLTGAFTSEPVTGIGGMYTAQSECQYAPSGGTSCLIVIETSVDEGLNWIDITRFNLSSSGTYLASSFSNNAPVPPVLYAALADNTARNGFLGDRLRAVITPTGTFSPGSSLVVNYFPRYRGRNGLYI